jgi:hypothetical protein
LILDHFVIRNLTIPPFIPVPHHARFSAGAIAGIVLGSLAGLGFIIIFTWFANNLRKKRKLAAAQRGIANGQGHVDFVGNQDGAGEGG